MYIFFDLATSWCQHESIPSKRGSCINDKRSILPADGFIFIFNLPYPNSSTPYPRQTATFTLEHLHMQGIFKICN